MGFCAIFLCFLFTLASPCWAQEKSITADEKPIITAYLWGQLGNQMFLVAAALAYAWDHDAHAVFPDLNKPDYRLSHNRDGIFFRLEAPLESPRPITRYFTESTWHSSEKIPVQPDQIIYGYFQSWQHFHHHRDKVLAAFAPSEEILSYLKAKYADLINAPNTVSLHVRTFNKKLHYEKIHPFIGLEYYRAAMDLFPPDTVFVVFSDRIQWCKKHFSKMKRQFVFIEGNDFIEDFFLMSMMKHQIICNSSFSWWAAYMNQNPGQTVIAPKCWMHPDYYDFPPPQPNDFYLPHWTIVQQNYDEPYPVDMTWYDITQSLDGN